MAAKIVFLATGPAPALTRNKADELPPDAPWIQGKDAGTLAWGEQYTIHAFYNLLPGLR